MAVDSSFFSLSAAINSVWTSGELNHGELKRISHCAGRTDTTPPSGETELLRLHEVVDACNYLTMIEGLNETSEPRWLTPDASQFPTAVRVFIAKVALHFHTYSEPFPQSFEDDLCRFINSGNSHVVTLNYDNLLYNSFTKNRICEGYDGALVDGFWSSGFKPNHMERAAGNDFGWYIHLHGSPLFVTDPNGVIKKLRQDEKDGLIPDERETKYIRHVVLSHFDRKPSEIMRSELLSTYWDFFNRALSESEHIIIFGYSGNDHHVNEAISWQRPRDVTVRVVERSKDGRTTVDRQTYWSRQLKMPMQRIQIDLMPNILDFNW